MPLNDRDNRDESRAATEQPDIGPDFSGLAVIVVNYGSSALLEENLAPLTRRAPSITVVVVDNFKSDDDRSRMNVLADREGWHSVLPSGNTGFGGGMNRGVLKAEQLGATHLLLLNPDAEIGESALSRLLELSRASVDTVFAPRILRPDGSVWFQGADLYLDDGRIRAAHRRGEAGPVESVPIEPWLSGACLLVPMEVWRRAEGFDEEYFLYWEDVDFSHRVVATGGRIAVADDAVAIHAQGGTQATGGNIHSGEPKSDVYYYYNIRNRLLFAVRHLDTESVVRWRRQSLPIAYEVLMRGGRRQFLHSLSPLVAAYRGLRDGRRMVSDELRMRRRLERSARRERAGR